MGIEELLLGQAKSMLDAMDHAVDDVMPEEIAEIVKFYSKGAAIAALASAWIPGAGGAAAVVVSSGFIWTMYVKISKKIGVPFGAHFLKSLASGMASNLAANVVGTIVLTTAFSLIPGIGSIGASVIMAATCYAIALGAGYLYMKILTRLFKKGVDLSTVSEDDLKTMAASATKEGDIKSVIKAAKADFKTRKARGEFDKMATTH